MQSLPHYHHLHYYHYPPSLHIPPLVDRRDDIPESEQPPRKRLHLSTIYSRYEIGESSTANAARGLGNALLEDAQYGNVPRKTQRVDMNSQWVIYLRDRIDSPETETDGGRRRPTASREAWGSFDRI
ncbi:hypothetical protein Tco_0099694 [Tanacetum coccineum]